MAKFSIVAGATSQSVNVFIQDSSQTTGVGLSGLVFNTVNLIAYYSFTGTNAGSVQIVLATLAAVNSAYSSGGFKEIDATNMKGWYRLDLPNAMIAAAKGRGVSFHLSGAANMAPCPGEIELTGVDNQDSVRMGMTALPNANAGAAGGLWILGANTGTTTFANSVTFNASLICNGVAAVGSTPATAGFIATGGAASTTGGGTAAPGIQATGGAGAASTNGAAIGATFSGGGTNTVASNAHGIQFLGTSTGHGVDAESGSGATGSGFFAKSNATNGDGLSGAGAGTGTGFKSAGGATGPGVKILGGATSGDGIDITTTSGDGVSILPTAGNGIVSTANGTSKHGAVFTGGTAGTSDGFKCVTGAGGVDLRAAITGNITGNLSGSVGSVTGAVGSVTATVTANATQLAGVNIVLDANNFLKVDVEDWKGATAPANTGDAFARLGAPAGASIAADIAAVPASSATSVLGATVETNGSTITRTVKDALKATLSMAGGNKSGFGTASPISSDTCGLSINRIAGSGADGVGNATVTLTLTGG